MIRRISLLKRHPELTPEEFMRHWLDRHAPLARDLDGLAGYRINQIRDAPASCEWDGLGELWFPSTQAAEEFAQRLRNSALSTDLGAFARDVVAFTVDEHVILPPPTG